MFDFIVDLYLELNQDKRNQEFEIEEIIQKEFKYSFIIDEKSKKSKSYQSLVKIKNV